MNKEGIVSGRAGLRLPVSCQVQNIILAGPAIADSLETERAAKLTVKRVLGQKRHWPGPPQGDTIRENQAVIGIQSFPPGIGKTARTATEQDYTKAAGFQVGHKAAFVPLPGLRLQSHVVQVVI